MFLIQVVLDMMVRICMTEHHNRDNEWHDSYLNQRILGENDLIPEENDMIPT